MASSTVGGARGAASAESGPMSSPSAARVSSAVGGASLVGRAATCCSSSSRIDGSGPASGARGVVRRSVDLARAFGGGPNICGPGGGGR